MLNKFSMLLEGIFKELQKSYKIYCIMCYEANSKILKIELKGQVL